MATSPLPVAEPQASISPFGRIIGVFFSPKATFEDIVRKPSWILPVILMMVVGAGIAFGINQKVNWRDYMSQQIEKSPRAANMSPEQKQQQIEGGAKFAPISSYVFGIPAQLVVVLIVAGVMLGAYNLLGGAELNFKTSLGIVAHSFVPTLVGSLLFLVVIFLKAPGTLDLDNPIATNVAAFLPEGIPKWVDALCKNVDIFVIWVLILMGIGFAASNPRKLKGGKAFTIALSVFAVYLVLRVGLAFIFS